MTRTEAVEAARIIKALIGLAEVTIILDTFIKAFLTKTVLKADGVLYLHGSFKIPGTVSGRMSSSDPNLQNIPSTGSSYTKAVKTCFRAPEGFLFAGADYSSLEDRISALTTKDPNKLLVYQEGYDGHCLRAYSYFSDLMPDIQNTRDSINSIEEKYPKLRQRSKGPTFLLTYQGTYHGLMKTLGFPEDEAIKIETNYHDLYQVSDAYVAEKLAQASIDGYVTVAFGLRVRTPVLRQVLLGKKSTPYAGAAESRTAGNALGQSYGLLNNRTGIEMQQRVLNSQYRYDIFPISQIHDASYFMVRDQAEIVEWFNKNLIECMEWQELSEIQHETVKLGGSVEIYHPTWATPIPIPNGATQEQLHEIASEHQTNNACT